jgi:RND superfamily putative drug exporter
MFALLGRIISRHWLLAILAWIVVLVLLRPPAWLSQIGIAYQGAPAWDDITLDGDFAYMPASMPSVVGADRMAEAFPGMRDKSQIVIVLAREGDEQELTLDDLHVGDRLAAVFHNLHAVALLNRLRDLTDGVEEAGGQDDSASKSDLPAERKRLLAETDTALNEALLLDEQLAEAYHNRAIFHAYQGDDAAAEIDRQRALQKKPDLAGKGRDELVPNPADPIPLVGVWTRHTELVGEKLRSQDGQAQLIVLHLANEFMAVDNIDLLETVYRRLGALREELKANGPEGLVLGVSGDAAVGGDMLLSADESLRKTELLTVTMVIVILVLVYRSPLLVAVPLATITLSFLVATSLVAMLTQLHLVPGFSWWDFNVFTTTEIFILVIMFGAGTDYCLFLISRYREEMAIGHPPGEAIERALSGVGDALAASALTTILGLLMMAFADFGKYRNSGPAIGFCLVISLLASITLAPAILRALGKRVFWPFGVGKLEAVPDGLADAEQRLPGRFGFFWKWLARQIVAYPGRILIIALFAMAPFAWQGRSVTVTYDLLGELSPACPCRKGTALLQRHFPVGESGPVVVLAHNEHGRFADDESLAAIEDLTKALYAIEGVRAVRSIAEPLGDPPKYTGVFDARKRALRNHRLARQVFHAQAPHLKGKITRFELLLEEDPFSIEAIGLLTEIESRLAKVAREPRAFWQQKIGGQIEDELTTEELADGFESLFAGTEFSFTGTTAALRDLRKVTQSDDVRIKILVVIAVFVVLLVILRRPIVCTYMVLSVLLSYYVTIGITQLVFSYYYGDTYAGLDWKVPLFLFVILVAVGQDYNVYLATRVFEEQRRHGPKEGLRRAVVLTGGIITSCGVIMAGTLVSMVSGSLRTMEQLGFSLSLGVIIDTFVVRPILVPSFIALLARFSRQPSTPENAPLDDDGPSHSR